MSYTSQVLEYGDDDNNEISFSGKGLSSEDVSCIITLFGSAKEINLSTNKMDCVPMGLPSQLLALNLAHNKFRSLVGFEQLKCLRLLKLQNNSITRYVNYKYIYFPLILINVIVHGDFSYVLN
jgi:hypothetical protein